MAFRLQGIQTGFETAESFHHRHSSIQINDKESRPSAGMPLDVSDGQVSVSNSEQHCLIVGSTGTGKTRRIVYPSIILHARAGNSLLIIDPKGEAYRNCSRELRKIGHEVLVVNLRNPNLGNRYNVLSLVEENWKHGAQDKAVSMLNDIAGILFARLSSDRDKYWAMTASNAFIGAALLLLEHNQTLTFDRIHNVINEYIRDKAEIEEKYRFNPLSDSFRYLSSISVLTADTTISCILSSFNAEFAPIIGQSGFRDLMIESSFVLAEMGKRKTALFCICPDESPSSYIIASFLVEQLYTELVYLADTDESNKLPVPVTFILDEFANITGCSWTHKLAAGRSRGIKFVLAVQTLSQLAERCGDYGAQVVINNCGTWVYLGEKDWQMIDLLERLYAVAFEKKVLLIRELCTLGKGRILVLDGPLPFIGNLPDWSAWNNNAKAKLSVLPREPKPLPPISIKVLLEPKLGQESVAK